MANEFSAENLLFEVVTPLGFHVRVTRMYWELIIGIKHPALAGREEEVKETLAHPDEIRLSRSDQNVYPFYRSERVGRWVCAVSKRIEEAGYVITAYPADAVKEGVRIWPK